MMPGIMTKKHKDALKTQLPTLTENLRLTAEFWSLLVQYKVCSISDKQGIENRKTAEGDRVFELVALLMKRPDRCYKKFVEALRKTDQEHLASSLEVKKSHRARKNTTRTTSAAAQTREEDIKDFIKNKVKYIPANAEYCNDSRCFFMCSLLELRDEYETERDTTVQKQLFQDIVTSTGITFWDEVEELEIEECKICNILEKKIGTDSSGTYKQQLENHLKAVEKVSNYSKRVIQEEHAQQELLFYLEQGYDICNLIYLYLISGKAEKYYVWEEIKAGFGTQEILSCLYHYINSHLLKVQHVFRIVLVTNPYGGILRNPDVLLFFLNLMSRSWVSEVQVVYDYIGNHGIDHRPYFVATKGEVIAFKFQNQRTRIRSLEHIINGEGDESIVHMKAEDMFRFSDSKNVLKTLNSEDIKVSLNTTRWLRMTRQESECMVSFASHFQETVEEGEADHMTRVRVSLPQAQTEFPLLYPDGFWCPVQLYREILNDASEDGENWVDYYSRQTHINESCTEMFLPHPDIIIQETDGLSDSDL